MRRAGSRLPSAARQERVPSAARTSGCARAQRGQRGQGGLAQISQTPFHVDHGITLPRRHCAKARHHPADRRSPGSPSAGSGCLDIIDSRLGQATGKQLGSPSRRTGRAAPADRQPSGTTATWVNPGTGRAREGSGLRQETRVSSLARFQTRRTLAAAPTHSGTSTTTSTGRGGELGDDHSSRDAPTSLPLMRGC